MRFVRPQHEVGVVAINEIFCIHHSDAYERFLLDKHTASRRVRQRYGQWRAPTASVPLAPQRREMGALAGASGEEVFQRIENAAIDFAPAGDPPIKGGECHVSNGERAKKP